MMNYLSGERGQLGGKEMGFIRFIVKKYRAWRDKRALRRIRETLAFFGVTVDRLSGEDIAQGIGRCSVMVSSEEAASVIRFCAKVGLEFEKVLKIISDSLNHMK
jgi:hypothetical protein